VFGWPGPITHRQYVGWQHWLEHWYPKETAPKPPSAEHIKNLTAISKASWQQRLGKPNVK